MSKQDRAYTRTASDLERKYNFGQSFAEVFGLVSDAQRAAEEAKKAVDGLTHEEIFNRLTNYGKVQGIYRGDDGDVYINASYIKSGKIAADYIDADNLNVKAANITGTLTADQVVLTGSITWEDLDSATQSAINSAGGISANEAKSIASTVVTEELVASPKIVGAEIYGGTFYGTEFIIDSEGSEGGLSLYGEFGVSQFEFFKIKYYGQGDFPITRLYAPAGGSLYIGANADDLVFECERVNFSGATVTGLSVVFG